MKKVMIIEDEPAYASLLHRKLARNYEVVEARNGKQGLDTAIQQKPDLILLDIRMPEMDGMTVLRELRKDNYGRSAKVIMLTNLEADDRITVRVSKDLPTYYFVKSDIELDYLLDKIQDLLQARESASNAYQPAR